MVKRQNQFIVAICIIVNLSILGLVGCNNNTLTAPVPEPGQHTESGVISGPGEEIEFSLNTEHTSLDTTFTWSEGWDPYAKVYGMNHNLLGEFRLADGNIINLTGGGLFYIAVGSYDGGGDWTCTYRE